MAMTKADKRELAECVARHKENGYGKKEAIERIHKFYGFKKPTIAAYWKAIVVE